MASVLLGPFPSKHRCLPAFVWNKLNKYVRGKIHPVASVQKGNRTRVSASLAALQNTTTGRAKSLKLMNIHVAYSILVINLSFQPLEKRLDSVSYKVQ